MSYITDRSFSCMGKYSPTDATLLHSDTADMYSNGESERILGVALKKFNIPRDQIVIASKVYNPAVEENPGFRIDGKPFNRPPLVNKGGLSRKVSGQLKCGVLLAFVY